MGVERPLSPIHGPRTGRENEGHLLLINYDTILLSRIPFRGRVEG